MQATRCYEVLPGPGAAVQALVCVVAACRAIYEHSWRFGDCAYELSVSTARAYRRGDADYIAANLSTVCAKLHRTEGCYDAWRKCRDLLYALESL